jgi:hypothetical protein
MKICGDIHNFVFIAGVNDDSMTPCRDIVFIGGNNDSGDHYSPVTTTLAILSPVTTTQGDFILYH